MTVVKGLCRVRSRGPEAQRQDPVVPERECVVCASREVEDELRRCRGPGSDGPYTHQV